MSLEQEIKLAIRDVPDFPKEGIIFKDIMPILENASLTQSITKAFAEDAKKLEPDAIMGIESRGFFWGLAIAQELGVPFIAVRKKGKLPYDTISYSYALEYGEAEIEVHKGVIQKGWKVIVHDDLLATGGTAAAAAELLKMEAAEVAGFSFLVILNFLGGKDVLNRYTNNILGLVNY